MKVSRTFSLEQKRLVDFITICKGKELNPNAVVERLLKDWNDNQVLAKIIACKKCGSKYSEVLRECPTCSMKKQLKKL